MKNKKRTNNTTTQDGNKEIPQLIGPSVTVNLKVSKSESECRAVEVANVESSQKPKGISKAKVVIKPEDIGISYTENLILKQGVKREDLLQEKFGMQQLSVLATMGDVENTRAFFDGDVEPNPNERVECDGSTPLILAADKKHVEIVKLLLEHGADCALTNNEGNNALMTAIKVGDADVINAIWPHRASVNLNHANKHGYTALHYAAERRWECCVQFLLGNGASADCQTNTGETPLMIAARLGDKKTAERLLQARADILISDQHDRTAICKAMEHGKTEVLAYLLDKLNDEDAEAYLRAELYYIRHPDEQDLLDDMYAFRMLIRLTKKPVLRDVFYSQKVISVVLDRMKDARQCPGDMLQLSALLCSIMFMFNKQPDVKLIKQYIYGGGPDFSTEIVKYYLGKLNIGTSEAIVSYLPIIGITEAPEGNAWLKKNAMRLMEFSSYFHSMCERKLSNMLCNMNDKLVDVDPDFPKVLAPMWKSFHATIFDIQKKQREKNLMELIKEEEREKEKKVKREKKNQKRKNDKEKKILKREDPDNVQAKVELDTVSTGNDIVKAGNLSQNSNENENENDSASKGAIKNKKKQKAKRSINYGLDNDSECFQEITDASSDTCNVFMENQMLNFSAGPDNWTTVQAKKHTAKEKEKEKVKEKQQELQDMKTEDFSTPKKSLTKTPKKPLDKRKVTRDRYQGQSACWADVAKGASPGKLPSQPSSVSANDGSGFSYEDEFPTLTGNKGHLSDLKSQSTINTEPNSAGQSPDDYQRTSSTYNSDGSCNPSTQSGLSLSSFCEIEPCAPDEKYYSDDEVLGCAKDLPPGDATYGNWEELVEINDDRYCTETYSTGQHEVRQVNSDTLRYLMDVYIASDDKVEAVEKFDSDDSSQNYPSASQDSTDKVDEVVRNDGRNSVETQGNEVNNANERKTDTEEGSYTDFRAAENKFWNEETSSSGNFGKIVKDGYKVPQTAYARDPSPTKSPRKRFAPHKKDGILHGRNARQTCNRNEYVQNSNQEQISTDDKFPTKATPRKVPVQFLDQTVSDNQQHGNTGQYEDISFGWDDEPAEEELPLWYTDTEPQNISDNWDGWNERGNGAFDKYQDNVGQVFGEPSNPINIGNGVASTKATTVPYDDIAADPCVVQYWTTPNTPNAPNTIPELHGQGHKEMNNTVPGMTANNDTKPAVCARNSPPWNSMHDAPKENTDVSEAGQPKKLPPGDSGNKTGKKTAIVKPINQPLNTQYQHARNSVNCALGQSILENAHRIDTTPDEVLFPSDLRDDSEPIPAEPDYFPSFHEDTRLSADYHPDAISVFHKIQQMQLTQLKSFYDAVQEHLQEKMSVYQNDFYYYASCTGLTAQQINDHLGIRQQEETYPDHSHYQPQYVASENTCYVNPTSIGRRDGCQTQYSAAENANRVHPSPGEHKYPSRSNDADVHKGGNSQYQDQQDVRNSQIYPDVRHRTDSSQRSDSYHNERPTITAENLDPNQVRLDAQSNADELKMLAAKGVADRVLDDIKAAYSAMVANAIKSRRWRDKLLDIRHMPAEDINMIGNIVFPKVNQARYIMSSRPDTVMLGFLLNGTPVAVRIVNWRSRHLIRDDLQALVDRDVSKTFMSKYRAFSFLNGNYYIAMDLYEYTLDEYLYKLKTDGQASPLYTNKLVWQFLRGLNSIHQQCLMVHGDLKPSNVVLDVSGNLRITGYGLGKRIITASKDIAADEKCWMAPEVLLQEQSDSFKADIWSAGMIMYFILSGGKQPPGNDPRDIAWNLSRRNLRMENINEEALHLLGMMMSLNKADRPATSEALRHPYFWAEEKRLRFVLIAGSDVLRDLKMGIPMTGGPGDSMIDILNSVQSSGLSDWMCEVDTVILKEMRTFRQYKNSVVELVLFVYNCCLHFEKMTSKAREIIDEPCKYFLTRFPKLFMTVYGAIKRSNRTEKTCYKPFF